MTFVWQSTATETSIFVACFVVVKIMQIYAKIQQLTKMPRSFQNINLKIFYVACCHSRPWHDAWATAHAKGITHANQVKWGLRRQ